MTTKANTAILQNDQHFHPLFKLIIIFLYPLKLSSPPITHTSTPPFLSQSSAHFFLQLASQLSTNHSAAVECVFITYRELEHLIDFKESLACFQI